VPRLLSAHLADAPLDWAGETTWRDTRIALPSHLGEAEFTHVLTGARFAPVFDGDGPHLPVATLFRTCPVAILIAAWP
jgi:maltooligosyltrehalose synthase